MKKMILAAACAAASGSIFADSTEQRILLLENELQRLKTELKEQKQQQNVLQAQQQEDRALTQKINTSSWKDNVDFYGILRMDGAVDFKSTTGRSSGGRTSNKINSVPFDGVEGNRSDFTVAASRFGVDINHLGGRKDVKAKLEADFGWTVVKAMANLGYVMLMSVLMTGYLARHGRLCRIWKQLLSQLILPSYSVLQSCVIHKSAISGSLAPHIHCRWLLSIQVKELQNFQA